MEEDLEIRIPERRAAQLFDASEGVTIAGIARSISMPLGSPKFEEVLALARDAKSRGEVLVTSWNIRRRYSADEMSRAELVKLIPRQTIEPAGEECGTKYDESRACKFCGAGRVQQSLLHLSSHGLPRQGSYVETIARDEWIISKAWAEIFTRHGGASAIFPVQIGDDVSATWLQLRAGNIDNVALLSDRTRFGISPFDPDEEGRFRCPLGHVAGLNLLSPAVVQRDSLTAASIFVSDKYAGIKQGLIRPWRLLFVRQPVWRDLMAVGTTGWSFDVADIDG